MSMIECCGCGRGQYPNELHPVGDYRLCRDCAQVLYDRLRDPDFMRGLVKSSMTMGEVDRMRKEGARSYATSDFAGEVACTR